MSGLTNKCVDMCTPIGDDGKENVGFSIADFACCRCFHCCDIGLGYKIHVYNTAVNDIDNLNKNLQILMSEISKNDGRFWRSFYTNQMETIDNFIRNTYKILKFITLRCISMTINDHNKTNALDNDTTDEVLNKDQLIIFMNNVSNQFRRQDNLKNCDKININDRSKYMYDISEFDEIINLNNVSGYEYKNCHEVLSGTIIYDFIINKIGWDHEMAKIFTAEFVDNGTLNIDKIHEICLREFKISVDKDKNVSIMNNSEKNKLHEIKDLKEDSKFTNFKNTYCEILIHTEKNDRQVKNIFETLYKCLSPIKHHDQYTFATQYIKNGGIVLNKDRQQIVINIWKIWITNIKNNRGSILESAKKVREHRICGTFIWITLLLIGIFIIAIFIPKPDI